jgi:hypothetical protein
LTKIQKHDINKHYVPYKKPLRRFGERPSHQGFSPKPSQEREGKDDRVSTPKESQMTTKKRMFTCLALIAIAITGITSCHRVDPIKASAAEIATTRKDLEGATRGDILILEKDEMCAIMSITKEICSCVYFLGASGHVFVIADDRAVSKIKHVIKGGNPTFNAKAGEFLKIPLPAN